VRRCRRAGHVVGLPRHEPTIGTSGQGVNRPGPIARWLYSIDAGLVRRRHGIFDVLNGARGAACKKLGRGMPRTGPFFHTHSQKRGAAAGRPPIPNGG
jgi:hypothetical protein